MKNKPNLLVFENLIEPVEDELKELDEIQKYYLLNNNPPPYVSKGLFAYCFALLEGAIGECLERYLFAYPEKLPKIKIDFERTKNELIDSDFSHEYIVHLIREYLSESSYENAGQIIAKYCEILDINNLETYFTKNLKEKKARRNSLIHNNLKIDAKYVHTAKSDPRYKGKYLRIKPEYVTQTLVDIKEILEKLHAELTLKYSSFTILNCIKQVWEYLFQSAIMKFDDYWGVGKDCLYIKTEGVKKYYDSLSSSEKTLLCYFVQNYNPGACSDIFNPHEMNMQVSNNHGMIFLVSVFDRFPLLLQNLNSIKLSDYFKYAND